VDAVGKQETAVENRHLCFGHGHERTVDIGDWVQANSPVGDRGGGGASYTRIVTTDKPFLRHRGGPEARNDEANERESSTRTSARGRCGACRRNRSSARPRRSRPGP